MDAKKINRNHKIIISVQDELEKLMQGLAELTGYDHRTILITKQMMMLESVKIDLEKEEERVINEN